MKKTTERKACECRAASIKYMKLVQRFWGEYQDEMFYMTDQSDAKKLRTHPTNI